MGSLIFGLLLFGAGYYLWPDFATLLLNFDEAAISALLDEDYINSGLKLGYFIAAGYYIVKSPFIVLKNLKDRRNLRSNLELEAQNLGLKNYDSLDNDDLLKEIEKKKEERKEKDRKRQQKEIEKKEAEERAVEEKRQKDLTKRFGEEDALKIINEQIWVGMTRDMLIESRGMPLDTDETVFKSKTKTKFFYDPWYTKQRNMRFKFRIDLENSVVVGWKDL